MELRIEVLLLQYYTLNTYGVRTTIRTYKYVVQL
jgi:hypothetical protein